MPLFFSSKVARFVCGQDLVFLTSFLRTSQILLPSGLTFSVLGICAKLNLFLNLALWHFLHWECVTAHPCENLSRFCQTVRPE